MYMHNRTQSFVYMYIKQNAVFNVPFSKSILFSVDGLTYTKSHAVMIVPCFIIMFCQIDDCEQTIPKPYQVRSKKEKKMFYL